MPGLWVTVEELGESAESPYAFEAAQSASYILWALSGRKYSGVVTVTERYRCSCNFTLGASALLYQPTLFGGDVYNMPTDGAGCGCAGDESHARLRLRGRPVLDIQKVVSGGRELVPDEWALEEHSVLSALSSGWSPCNSEITYTYGSRPPTAGRRAARYLAIELTKAWAGEDCSLPERVTSVSRQGVSYTILDNQDFIADMRTGVYAVDLFLKATNPDNARARARVFSPDVPRARRVVHRAASSVVGPYDFQIIPGEAKTFTIDLSTTVGDFIDGVDWKPVLQINNWNGALVRGMDAEDTTPTIVDGVMTVALTAADTRRIAVYGDCTWDLYARNVTYTDTYVYALTGRIIVTPLDRVAVSAALR